MCCKSSVMAMWVAKDMKSWRVRCNTCGKVVAERTGDQELPECQDVLRTGSKTETSVSVENIDVVAGAETMERWSVYDHWVSLGAYGGPTQKIEKKKDILDEMD